MVAIAPIKLRQGVELVRGVATYDEHSASYHTHYLVDTVAHQTLESLSDDQMRCVLGRPSLDVETRTLFIKELKQKHLLSGQHVTKQATGTPDQKMLYQSIPLPFKPDYFITQTLGLVRWLASPIALIGLLFIACCAVILIARQHTGFIEFTAQAFSVQWLTANALHFGLAFLFVRVLHELAHAYACKLAGGHVDGFVITYIAGVPLPSTKMNYLHQAGVSERLKIALAGIYIELWIAVFAIYGWLVSTSESYQALWHYLAVINPVLTLSANIVPLMKFDGYHAWSSWLRNPKLYEMAIASFRRTVHQLIGIKSITPNTGLAYQWVLPVYGFMIFIWKTLVIPIGLLTGIVLLFDYDRFGYVFITAAILVFYIKPFIKEIKKMANSEGFEWNTSAVVLVLLGMLGLGWFIAPLPHVDTVTGGVLYQKTMITAPNEGNAVVLTSDGPVTKDHQLAQLHSNQIKHQRNSLNAQHEKLLLEEQGMYGLYTKAQTLNVKAQQLDQQQIANTLYAPQDGYWRVKRQTFYSAGGAVGELINADHATLNVYIPKSITSAPSLVVSYSAENGQIGHTTVNKVSDVSVTSSIPAFLLDTQSGVFDAQRPVQAIQHYSAPSLPLPEGWVTVYVKTRYSLAAYALNQLKQRLVLL